jgi:hypothetical protein
MERRDHGTNPSGPLFVQTFTPADATPGQKNARIDRSGRRAR